MHVQVVESVLKLNDDVAAHNRQVLKDAGVFTIDLIGGPGCGKTTLVEKTIAALRGDFRIGVIVGDLTTARDAERIAAACGGKGEANVIQINTGKGCHLDAAMVEAALTRLTPAEDSVLFVENVGNLVCPAAFDLGEAHKVAILSVTEGEDKPLKDPDMFAAADLMLLNKSDLLPHLDFDVGACLANALRVNPRLQTLVVSARTGEGMQACQAWVEARAAHVGAAPPR